MTLDEAAIICAQFLLDEPQEQLYRALLAALPDADVEAEPLDLFPVLAHVFTDIMAHTAFQEPDLAPAVLSADVLGLLEQLFLAKYAIMTHRRQEDEDA